MNFVGSDRNPTIRLWVGNEELIVGMVSDGLGGLLDGVDLPGQATHERVEIKFTPKNLTDALSAAPNDKVSLGYNPSGKMRAVHIDGGSGFEAWIAPRADVGEKKDG
jgi:hypothetical protein